MTLQAIGAVNGTLPVPTGILIGFIRDPASMPYLRYAQLVAAPEVNFQYFRINPDDPVRLVDLNRYAWGYDAYRPEGRDFVMQIEATASSVQRWDFPYTIGNNTQRIWSSRSGISPQAMYNRVRANHARLHRAVRVVQTMQTAFTGAQTADLNTMLGTSGAGFDLSSGQELLSADVPNPNFQVIKKAFLAVKQRLNLATNNAITGEEMIAVLPVAVAKAIGLSGEMVNFLKQSPYAKELTDPNIRDWMLPPYYGGFKLVVEDTPRCFINQSATGAVADVSVASQKDYILDENSVYFVSRPGGLDGGYGYQNFSTIQIFHFNGEGRVEAFSEPKHDLTEGHVVLEDKVLAPAPLSGFKLTGVLQNFQQT
jgi:hypothetical protein